MIFQYFSSESYLPISVWLYSKQSEEDFRSRERKEKSVIFRQRKVFFLFRQKISLYVFLFRIKLPLDDFYLIYISFLLLLRSSSLSSFELGNRRNEKENCEARNWNFATFSVRILFSFPHFAVFNYISRRWKHEKLRNIRHKQTISPPPSVTESKCAQICNLFYFLYKFRFVQFCQCKVKKFVTTKSPPHTANLCIRSSRSSHVQVGQYRRANKIPAQHNKFPFEVQFFILCFTVNFIFFLYVYP